MPVMYGLVGPPSNISAPDGLNQPVVQGKSGEINVVELHGKYYTTAYRATSYIGTNVGTGVVPPIYTTTAQVFGLWNRAGNTRNAVLQVLDCGIIVTGAQIAGSLSLSQSLNAGSALATGGISVFTAGTPQGGNIGISGGNTVSFTPSAATTLAATLLMVFNYSFFSTAAPVAGAPQSTMHYDFEGGVIVPPNNAVWLTSCPAAQTTTWGPTLRWEEPPI